ncbi:kinase-like domain-containing protein, partial [Spinellus fusiger]
LLDTFIDNCSLRLESVLGIGAYGIVYLGRHIYSDRLYAVKLLTNLKASHNEVEIQKHLSDHHNILHLEKTVHEDGLTFIILEYASEGDLFSAITHSRHGLVGNNRAIRHIFLQIIDAVQHCHNHNIAHRDLKPENILMFPDWHIKLADFGLATTHAVSTEFGCGSTFYFSPECQGSALVESGRLKGYDTKLNDIWSLGVILVNFVAGRNPWKKASMDDPTFAVFVSNPHTFFETVLPCVSEELALILRRVFCLDPTHRISLEALRMSIIYCRAFTRQDSLNIFSWMNCNSTMYPNAYSPPTADAKSRSFILNDSGTMSQTLLDYISDFTDDD